MKPQSGLFVLVTVVLGGCTSWPAWQGLLIRAAAADHEAEPVQIRLVGDLATPANMNPVAVENVGLVTGLKGTGSDPRPSPQRSALLAEMHLRGVDSPNALLASKSTSLVLVRGLLRPGIQKGDRFDVEVRVPSQSETTSLRGGYLLETELKQLAVLQDNAIHEGRTYGLAQGPVLVDPSASPKNGRVLASRGRILGGGVALRSLPLGLVLRSEHQSVANAARVEAAINRRFHTFDRGGIKTGVAKARTDRFIELKLHPRYKENVYRYMAVIRSTVLRESETELSQRLRLLEDQLLDPPTASRAALQLEAIGRPAIEVLLKGIHSPSAEVRFYAAEALAYLDDSRAAVPLGQAARHEPAFRVYALSALSGMDDYSAAEQLRELLKVPSAETRYGAFRALWIMNPNDPLIRGEDLGGQFSYHQVADSDPPMIHLTRSRRPEIVLFGRDQRFQAPLALEAGNRIMVTSSKPGEVTVSKFSVHEPDQKRLVSDRVDEVIRAIVELGGTYPDVVQALQEAKASGALSSRLEVDALPEPGRPYDRSAELASPTQAPEHSSPSPDPAASPKADQDPPAQRPGLWKAFLGKLTGRRSG
ncbi:MAG: flagellar basal body P-ring protein FlgI [Thermoguttaceae bacterium]